MRLEYRFEDSRHWYGPVGSGEIYAFISGILSRHGESVSVRINYSDESWVEYREFVPEASDEEASLVHSVATSLERRG